MPLVSYVLPTIRDKFLQETIDSIYAQTLKDWELIIVDGAGRNLKFNDPRIKVINEVVPPQEGGNIGRRNAQSDVILHVADDDIELPNRAEKCYQGIQNGADVFIGSYIKVDEDNKEIKKQITGPYEFDGKFNGFGDYPPMATGYKSSVCPYFRKDLMFMADIWFLLESKLMGLNIVTDTTPLARVRNWEGSMSTSTKTHEEKMMWEVDKNKVRRLYEDKLGISHPS